MRVREAARACDRKERRRIDVGESSDCRKTLCNKYFSALAHCARSML
jgi:hypothetical protein